MPINITPTREGELRTKSPLIKRANTCKSCRMLYVCDTNRVQIGYACAFHQCGVDTLDWCKHHKRRV